MTDNENITDIEIIKALEYIDDNVRWMLFECPVKWATSVSVIAFRARHLIYRLQAENERLDKEVDRLSQVVLYNDGVTEMKVEEAKAEAYKEFEELLKTFITENNIPFTKEIEQLWIKIDDILKEKVGNIDVK